LLGRGGWEGERRSENGEGGGNEGSREEVERRVSIFWFSVFGFVSFRLDLVLSFQPISLIYHLGISIYLSIYLSISRTSLYPVYLSAYLSLVSHLSSVGSRFSVRILSL